MCTKTRKPTKPVLIPEDAVAALGDVLTYLWYDERRHYGESRPGSRPVRFMRRCAGSGSGSMRIYPVARARRHDAMPFLTNVCAGAAAPASEVKRST
jgi:hypothetical protein